MKFSIFYKNIFNHVSCGQSKNKIKTYRFTNKKTTSFTPVVIILI